MSFATPESVLVIPTAAFHRDGVFQGFRAGADDLLPGLLDPAHLSYRPRAEVETDPTFKQIIPYVVLKCGDRIFHYQRGKRATEARLQALWSVGVGGHINADDRNLFDPPYREAMFREVAEEVDIQTTFAERCVGLINDDATPVGQVHLGIVHVFDLAEPRVTRRETALTRAAFAPLAELRSRRGEFESWSQFVLDAGVLGG